MIDLRHDVGHESHALAAMLMANGHPLDDMRSQAGALIDAMVDDERHVVLVHMDDVRVTMRRQRGAIDYDCYSACGKLLNSGRIVRSRGEDRA